MRLPWGRIVSCFAGNTPPPPTQTPRALEMLMTGYYYDQASHASVSQLEILFADELPKEHVPVPSTCAPTGLSGPAAVSLFSDHDRRLGFWPYGIVDVIFVTFLMK